MYVHELLSEKLPSGYLFHNFQHTQEVAEMCREIAAAVHLSKKEAEHLLLAAWFHDTGFVEKREGHEEKSAQIARAFLSRQNYPEEQIKTVERLILSTKPEPTPGDTLEKILHDADIAHVGRKRFFKRGDLLRMELEQTQNVSYSDNEWAHIQLDFLINNKFCTLYAREKFDERRMQNIEKQRSNIQLFRKQANRSKAGKDLGRGIDTLYRSTFRNHINLSSIADGKANMMISINAIILSVIITLSGAGFSFANQPNVDYLRYTIPVLILLMGSLISVIFAILSARPKVTQRTAQQEAAQQDAARPEAAQQEAAQDQQANLLYFGNFLGVSRAEFVRYLNSLKVDQDLLYDNMADDLYNLGLVLRRKYKMLSISYNVFMGGLVLSVLAFMVIFLYTNLS
jgi:predicted metal-dependent HD superfamily phosphohydrolase